jgi:hypothetical protein
MNIKSKIINKKIGSKLTVKIVDNAPNKGGIKLDPK